MTIIESVVNFIKWLDWEAVFVCGPFLVTELLYERHEKSMGRL